MIKPRNKSVDLVQEVLDNAALRKSRMRDRTQRRTTISLTLDNELIDAFKALEGDWRANMITVLREAASAGLGDMSAGS